MTEQSFFVFKPMKPEVQEVYDSIMEHANRCREDIQEYETQLLMHELLLGKAFPQMTRMGRQWIEQSHAMEQEANDLAFALLSGESIPVAAPSQESTPKAKPFYRRGRW